jgi:hypothetical protein
MEKGATPLYRVGAGVIFAVPCKRGLASTPYSVYAEYSILCTYIYLRWREGVPTT